MTAAGTLSSSNVSPACRVLLWWDVDVEIGTYKRHKLTARPLRVLERQLGHRVHVESRGRYPIMPEGVWKFEAFSYLDTADPDLAVGSLLQQLSSVSDWFWGWGYRPVTSLSGNFDKDAICSFYWTSSGPHGEHRRVLSGGVMLTLVEKPQAGNVRASGANCEERRRINARPVVKIGRQTEKKHDYDFEMGLRFTCANRQKLIDIHWPRLVEKYGVRSSDSVDFGPVPNGAEPNEIRVRGVLKDVFEHNAVAFYLARSAQCRFRLGGPNGAIFRAERFPDQESSDGISSITLTRAKGA